MIATAFRNALAADNALRWSDAFILSVLAAPGCAAAIAVLYIMKSALGINVMPGPSPLHDLLFWLLT